MKIFFILLLVALNTLPGCGSETPHRPGKNCLKYILAAEPASLDPAATEDPSFYHIAFNMLETLLAVNWQTGDLEPVLATHWQPDSSHRRWTFVLRRDVLFHDGSRLNAIAVKASFERQFLPGSQYYHPQMTDRHRLVAFDMIQEILTPNDSTVQFILKYPHAAFLDNLASPFYATIVSPQALATYGKNFGRHPIGTGPFEFVRWDSASNIVIKKNPRYWRERAQLDSVVFQVVANLETRINELRQGRAEVIGNLSAASVFSFHDDSSITMIEEPSLATVMLGMKNRHSPFNARKARQALTHAINRNYIVINLGHNLSIPAKGILSPILSYADTTITVFPYDTAKAKTLWQDSHERQRILRLCQYVYTDSLRRSPLLQEIKHELKEVGITTAILTDTEWQQYEKNVLAGDGADLFLVSHLSFTRHPYNFLYALFHSQSPQNYFGYQNREVDALLLRARRTGVPEIQRRLYRRIQEIILRDAPAVFINHPKIVYATRSHLKNFRANPLGIPSLATAKLEKPPKPTRRKFLW